jgi:hypothetical protein
MLPGDSLDEPQNVVANTAPLMRIISPMPVPSEQLHVKPC